MKIKAGNKEVKIDFYCDILIEGSKNSVNEVAWVVNDFGSGFPEVAKEKVKTGTWTRMAGSKFVSLNGKRQLYIPGNAIDLANSKVYIKNLEVKITGDNLTGKSEPLKNWLDAPKLKDALASHFDYFGLAVTWDQELSKPKGICVYIMIIFWKPLYVSLFFNTLINLSISSFVL